MQAIIFATLLAAASANTIFRSPAHDSAVIKSDRVGGNFAYSVAENQAYGVVQPVVSHVTQPVATTYTVPSTYSVPSTYAVQNAHVVNTVPSTYAVQNAHVVNTVASPVVSNLEYKSVPVTTNVATTYGTWPQTYTYGNTIASSSPIVYNAHTNVPGVQVEKRIDQVQHVQPSWGYTVQQPSTSHVVAAPTQVTSNGLTYSVPSAGYSGVNWVSGYGQPNWAMNTNTWANWNNAVVV